MTTTATSQDALPPAAPPQDAAALAEVNDVIRAQNGDVSAFEALMTRHQRAIYFAIVRRVGHQDDAADLVQQTFLRAFERLSSLREPAAFKG